MNKAYEKPTMKIVPLQGNKNIAETCWGNHSENQERYYDTIGKGYVGFYVSGGECGLSQESLVVKYYDHKGATDYTILTSADAAFQELYNKLIASGGAEGNPFKGMSNFPGDPGGMS